MTMIFPCVCSACPRRSSEVNKVGAQAIAIPVLILQNKTMMTMMPFALFAAQVPERQLHSIERALKQIAQKKASRQARQEREILDWSTDSETSSMMSGVPGRGGEDGVGLTVGLGLNSGQGSPWGSVSGAGAGSLSLENYRTFLNVWSWDASVVPWLFVFGVIFVCTTNPRIDEI